uniref:Uncharacterized protein n=1 Tax=viral metagenome TaxID=1070528 RepID=A0A6C0F3T1_9ZZZZ
MEAVEQTTVFNKVVDQSAGDNVNISVSAEAAKEEQKTRLVDVEVTDQNTALTLMVSFLNLAQRRGSFTFDESGKIWECIKSFQK